MTISSGPAEAQHRQLHHDSLSAAYVTGHWSSPVVLTAAMLQAVPTKGVHT